MGALRGGDIGFRAGILAKSPKETKPMAGIKKASVNGGFFVAAGS
jgi:hypothetical protein